MDWEEALEYIQLELSEWESECQSKHPTKDALQMAVEAIEKQIEKPVRTTTSTKRCGRCGRQLSGNGNLHPKRIYCTKCGQKIAWR
jgi:DNA-directed RNA polymerase subunit RPC12/RpoP